VVTVDLDLPVADWNCDLTAAKLTELFGRPYKGVPLTGKDLLELTDNEKQKRLGCGKAELWKLNDYIAMDQEKRSSQIESFQNDLTNPPPLPEELEEAEAKFVRERERSDSQNTDHRMSRLASDLVSDIFKTEDIENDVMPARILDSLPEEEVECDSSVYESNMNRFDALADEDEEEEEGEENEEIYEDDLQVDLFMLFVVFFFF
jgi:hypothetical protein